MVEAYDILELMCSMARDNIKLIEFNKECSEDLLEPVTTILYATDRVDVPELKLVKSQFQKRYGLEFCKAAQVNQGRTVNERIITRLNAFRPNAYIVLNYLKEIALEKDVDWEPDEMTATIGQCTDRPMTGPNGSSVAPGNASGLGTAAYQVTDGTIERKLKGGINDLELEASPADAAERKATTAGSSASGINSPSSVMSFPAVPGSSGSADNVSHLVSSASQTAHLGRPKLISKGVQTDTIVETAKVVTLSKHEVKEIVDVDSSQIFQTETLIEKIPKASIINESPTAREHETGMDDNSPDDQQELVYSMGAEYVISPTATPVADHSADESQTINSAKNSHDHEDDSADNYDDLLSRFQRLQNL